MGNTFRLRGEIYDTMVLVEWEGRPMDKFVARLYIHDYREKIAAEADDAQRQELLHLLANLSVSRQSASWFPRQTTP